MEKRYDHITGEQAAQNQWAQEKTYQTPTNTTNLFSIDTPPPTVSGTLHIGHIFSYTQTDIIARYKRMAGFSVFYPFGFDDNGLPTERYVEKKLAIRAHTMERSQFIELCLQETAIARSIFTQLWQKMGISADWSNTYSTISAASRRIAQQSFLDLLKKNQVYRQYEPAIYCTACRTSVAQADLDDAQHASFFNDIVFLDQKGNQLIVGTTRPELLFSCVALLYHPQDERYTYLEGQYATTPLFNQKVPIFADPLVKIDKGTGLVMVCTFGDKTDIEWYKKYNLPYIQSIGLDGKLMSHIAQFAGLSVLEARTLSIELLQANELLIKQQPIMHTVSVHERCKKPVEYVMLAQWFVKILEHKKTFIDLADQIAWHPAFMKSRYINWVENLQWDWGISRQRSFGIPFPVWHCQDCGTVLPAQEKDLPIDPQEKPYNNTCTQCNSSNIIADKDVMDTWNTSSLSPYICAQLFKGSIQNPFTGHAADNLLPMAMRPQAHDIIRTWAFYTIVKTYLHHGTIAWKEIVISGHVLSDYKEKISKSKGNSMLEPAALLQQYPADAIRYWTASATLGYDTAFSVDQLKIGQRLITKLWNAFLFAQPHVQAITHASTVPEHLGIINEWLLHTLSECETIYHQLLNNTHDFGQALSTVEDFFWNTYCDNYIELTKNQLFNPEHYDDQTIYATRWTLYQVGIRILQLYAPYVPHVTETIYNELYKKEEKTASLHQTQFATYGTVYLFAQSAHKAGLIIQLISNVRKAKTEAQLSLKTPLACLTVVSADSHVLEIIQSNEQTIKGITQAHTMKYALQDLDSLGLHNTQEEWYLTVVL